MRMYFDVVFIPSPLFAEQLHLIKIHVIPAARAGI